MLNGSLVALVIPLVLAILSLGVNELSESTLKSAADLLGAVSTSELPVGKEAVTTVFWVGEKASRENDHIANDQSAWDGRWKRNFGGTDDPEDRCGYYPCDFTPEENPFYVALPYNDLNEHGRQKREAEDVPWFDEEAETEGSILKDHWVAVTHKNKTCYGQWEDAGPNNEDDFDYVFGDATEPENTFGAEAGLDISPALRDCLGVGDVSNNRWYFVDEEEVPDGPWLKIVTGS